MDIGIGIGIDIGIGICIGIGIGIGIGNIDSVIKKNKSDEYKYKNVIFFNIFYLFL